MKVSLRWELLLKLLVGEIMCFREESKCEKAEQLLTGSCSNPASVLNDRIKISNQSTSYTAAALSIFLFTLIRVLRIKDLSTKLCAEQILFHLGHINTAFLPTFIPSCHACSK